MGAKFSFPSGSGTVRFSGAVIPSNNSGVLPSHFSQLGAGGLHEVVDLDERNDITSNDQGRQDTGSIYSSGRRTVGMLVHVYGISDPTIYKLIPQGYWGNGGTKGYTDWIQLGSTDSTDANYGGYARTSLLNPGKVFTTKGRSKYVYWNGNKYGPFSTAQATAKSNEIKNSPSFSPNLCWVKLELGGDTTPYVNGVKNMPGAWPSVDQTGEAGDAPAVYGNKKFVNSELHLKYDSSDTIGGLSHLSDLKDDAALKVDKKVTIGTASEEIFSVKENTINLHTVTNLKNIPNVTNSDTTRWGHTVPIAGDEMTVGLSSHEFTVGDLYTFQNPEGHTIIGVVAT
jgi:hypothetical protein|tara:strand:- start:4277 stop:5299 length:1023 start_codon:yes stop_codon:yes gene_type:complete